MAKGAVHVLTHLDMMLGRCAAYKLAVAAPHSALANHSQGFLSILHPDTLDTQPIRHGFSPLSSLPISCPSQSTDAGLTKEYKNATGGSKLAVDKLDLTMYSGQITALLGHNGAGKVP